MEKKKAKEAAGGMNRRDFLATAATGIAGFMILPSFTVDGVRIAPSDRVVLGFVGLGQQGCSDFNSFTGCPGVQVAACCDVDSIKRERFRRYVTGWQKSKGMPQRCDMYEQYEQLLERKDIDAIEIATPDHWHALVAIHSVQAGKDVYLQKPQAYTITEGLAVQAAVRANHRILQMGSQQRSSAEFQQAIALVRAGGLGNIKEVYCRVGEPPKPLDLPEMPVPENLNWNLWMGPLTDPKIHYHPDLCPPISLDPAENEKLWGAWRWYKKTGGGYMTDWGAHMFDIVQWALGKDGSGPTEVIPPGYSFYKNLTYKYDNGVVVEETTFDDKGQGVKIYGDEGWIAVHRGNLYASDPKFEMKVTDNSVPFEARAGHHRVFIESVKSRIDPNVPVEVGHSSCNMCNIGIIAGELGRPLVWNPIVQKFMHDDEANALKHYDYREGYKNLLDV